MFKNEELTVARFACCGEEDELLKLIFVSSG